MGTEAKAKINVQRELGENCEFWPEPSNLGGLICVFCGDTPKYPTMQCTEGHLICESEGQHYLACPGPDPHGGRPRCGAQLLAVKLKWLRWLLEFGLFQCSDPKCKTLVFGKSDKKNHLENHSRQWIKGEDSLFDIDCDTGSENGESRNRRSETDDEASKHFIEDILNMDNSPCEVNEPTSHNCSTMFKFLPEEEKIYLENKEEIDKAPEEFLHLFIRNGQTLPPDQVYRELCVIRDRLDLGLPLLRH